MKPRILIIDDEPGICYSLCKIFNNMNYDSESAQTGADGLSLLSRKRFDLVILDNRMHNELGINLLASIRSQGDPLIIMMTAFPTAETAIQATKNGAFDFIIKPFDTEELKVLVRRALSVAHLTHDKVQLISFDEIDPRQEAIIGKSKAMQQIYKMIGQVAEKDITVLITGETGTGKELVARAIHQHSLRKTDIFLPVNCAAIPCELIESELFGHEKGAFTGAHLKRIGKFEQCNKGTIFLDEISELSLAMQAKLLRFLQDKTFQRVGSNETLKSNSRILSATNVDLKKSITEGKFREDLFYRISIICLELPPLRKRMDDLDQLVRYFLTRFGKETASKEIQISQDAMKTLQNHNWPGNIRELENVIKRGVLTCKHATIFPEDLESVIEPLSASSAKVQTAEKTIKDLSEELIKLFQQESNLNSRKEILNCLEKELIILALEATGGNEVQASSLLGMNRSTLRKKIASFGISKETRIKRLPT